MTMTSAATIGDADASPPTSEEMPLTEDSIFDAEGALTRAFLLERGFCCENGCKNCPYGFHHAKDATP